MALNFQDVIRDVHDASNHRLNTSGGANTTIFAVVNTSAAGIATVVVGNPTVYLGTPTINAVVNLPVSDPTVYIGTPTLYAVVNTGAAGVGNSMVTINPRTDYFGLVSVSGNVVVSSLPSIQGKVVVVDSTGAEMDLFKEGDNYAAADHGIAILGLSDGTPQKYAFMRVEGVDDDQETPPTKGIISSESYQMVFDGSKFDRARTANAANATTGLGTVGAGILGFDGTNYRRVKVDANGILQGNVTIASQPALVASSAYIGLVSVSGFANPMPVTGTFYQASQPVSFSNVTINSSVNSIGFATVNIVNQPALVASSANIGSVSILGGGIGLNAGINAIGFATVYQASSARTITGNVTLSDAKTYVGLVTATLAGGTLPSLVAGAAYVGLASVNIGGTLPALSAGAAFVGIVTVTNQQPLVASTVNIGSVSVLGGGIGINAGVNNIGFATVNVSNFANSTIYAVVNTGAAGQASVVISPSANYIGLVTAVISNFANSTIYAVVNTAAAGQSSIVLDTGTKNIGSVSILGGGIGLNAGVNSIGFASVTPVAVWPDPKTYIGLVTITGSLAAASGNVTITDGKTYIGGVTATLATGTSNIGSVSVLGGTIEVSSLPALVASTVNIGSVSVLGGTINSVLQTSTLNVGSVSVLGGTIAVSSLPALVAGVGNIGFASVTPVKAWPDPLTYVGLVTATVGNTLTVNAHALTASTVNIGSVSVLGGTINSVLQTSTLNVGSVSVLGGTIAVSSLPALVASTVNIGSVSVLGGGIGINAGVNNIGFATVYNAIGTQFIGLVTVAPHALTGLVTLADAKTYIGLTTTTLGIGTTFIGLVTAWTRNAGSAKTIVSLPIAFAVASIATIAIPATNLSVNITNLVIGSNATTQLRIKSGVTYLTGNASLGVTLFPGGGFSLAGAPDSPSWIGLPSGALVIEKFDTGGIISQLGGTVNYFTE